ncbi:MAG: response regulator [Candidatus Omnitrophica bacterium]|nr:response regulator [Candidatus Omnitrophota bacterium]
MKKNAQMATVLCVDDEEAIREAMSELLENCGYRVLSADGYDEAVAYMKGSQEIEAVICDLKMPGKSGLDVLRHVSGQEIKIPFIFLTGYGTLESCQEAVREGAFDYILKPIDSKDKVLLPLGHAVEKYRLEKENRELQEDIIKLAEEHEKILDSLLEDRELKDKVQARISSILDKWK